MSMQRETQVVPTFLESPPPKRFTRYSTPDRSRSDSFRQYPIQNGSAIQGDFGHTESNPIPHSSVPFSDEEPVWQKRTGSELTPSSDFKQHYIPFDDGMGVVDEREVLHPKESESQSKTNGTVVLNGNSAHNKAKEASEDQSPVVPRLYKRRWIMVLLFATYSMSNAYQWIHLNIIGDLVHKYYNASMPGNEYQQLVALDWLSMIYMLAYIPLIFPATWLLDKKGLRICGLLATFLNALGAWIKCGALSPDRFPLLMTGQTVCAIAQIFVLGIPARLAAVWFGPNEVSTATAIGVFGNQIGCALGFLIPPLIVPFSDDLDFIGKRLSYMLFGGAGIMTFLFIVVIIVFKNGPPVPPSQAQACAVEHAAQEEYSASLIRLVKHKGFIMLMITYGANTGSYYAIGTLLNPIVLYYYPDDNENAGLIGLTLVVAGVGGSILAGLWLDKTKLYKWTTVGIYFMSFAGMIIFTFTLQVGKIWVVFLCSGMLGFFMTGYLPVGFEFAAELTFPEPEGTSSGLLNASAQTFGIILTLGLRALSDVYGMLPANLAISATLLLGTVCTGVIPSDLRRQKAGRQILNEEQLTLNVECDDKAIKDESKV